ncbi:MAG: hypothetical protein JST82_09885 [Bacteroidetes bacterium]|nr:hypothetical protein [Bacteroidota bacterium]
MKQTIAILVMCMYTLGLTGLSVSYHYCGDTFMYVELETSHTDKKACRESCCGKKNDRCCHDKVVKMTIKEHKQTVSKFVMPTPKFDDICLNTPTCTIYTHKTQHIDAGNFYLRPPPLRTVGQPLYILNSVFRI